MVLEWHLSLATINLDHSLNGSCYMPCSVRNVCLIMVWSLETHCSVLIGVWSEQGGWKPTVVSLLGCGYCEQDALIGCGVSRMPLLGCGVSRMGGKSVMSLLNMLLVSHPIRTLLLLTSHPNKEGVIHTSPSQYRVFLLITSHWTLKKFSFLLYIIAPYKCSLCSKTQQFN